MKVGKIILMVFFSQMILSAACRRDTESCHYTVYVNNKSNKTIYATYNPYYPDTSILDINPVPAGDYHKIIANEKKSVYSKRDCIEDYFKFSVPSDTIMIFIFDADVLASNSWETVRRNYLVLKRYDLSLSDLKNANFSIDYP